MKTESIINMELNNLNIFLDNYNKKDIDTKIEMFYSILKIENLILDLNETDKQLHYKEILDSIINKNKFLKEMIKNKFETENLEKINISSKNAMKIIRSILFVSGIMIVSAFANKYSIISENPFNFSNKTIIENPIYLEKSDIKNYLKLIDELKLLKEVYKYNLTKSLKNKTNINYNTQQIDIYIHIIIAMLKKQYPNNIVNIENRENIENIENISLKKLFENIDETMGNIEKIGKINNLSEGLKINRIIQGFYTNLKIEIKDTFSHKFFRNNTKKINIFIPDFNKLDKQTQQIMLKNINISLKQLNLKIKIDKNSNFILLDMNNIIEENKLSN